jgi:flagellar hook-associated protein FlgK
MFTPAKVSAAAAVSIVMDKIDSVLQTALGGIRTNLRKLHDAANEIATAPARGADPVELDKPLVAALEAQRALEASAAVMRRADQTLDSLLEALR